MLWHFDRRFGCLISCNFCNLSNLSCSSSFLYRCFVFRLCCVDLYAVVCFSFVLLCLLFLVRYFLYIQLFVVDVSISFVLSYVHLIISIGFYLYHLFKLVRICSFDISLFRFIFVFLLLPVVAIVLPRGFFVRSQTSSSFPMLYCLFWVITSSFRFSLVRVRRFVMRLFSYMFNFSFVLISLASFVSLFPLFPSCRSFCSIVLFLRFVFRLYMVSFV